MQAPDTDGLIYMLPDPARFFALVMKRPVLVMFMLALVVWGAVACYRRVNGAAKRPVHAKTTRDKRD